MKEVYGKRERFLINSSLLILQETMAELVNPLTTRSDKHLASPNGFFFYVSGMNSFVPREPLNQKSVREGDIQKNIGSLTLASSTLKALTANTDVLDILGSSNKQRKFS